MPFHSIFFQDYWLTRFVFLRLLGFVYFFAFLSLATQVVPLLGERGLTPAKQYLKVIEQHYGSKRKAFIQLPSIFWLRCSDTFLKTFAWTGVILSLVVLFGYANVPLLFLLWSIYLSFLHIGQVWYGYGWETQLLETNFLALFMVPLLDPRPFPSFAPPVPVMWLLLWLTFRMHIGAGLIKLRGDRCWRDLTCLYYHFETQPIPNPLSPYFHFLPKLLLKFGTLWNHFIELIVPFFIFVPGIVSWIAGLLLISFQALLILSGNLAFLNWVTIVPIVAAFDDRVFSYILPDFIVQRAEAAALQADPSTPIAAWIVLIVVAWLSIPVVKNLFSRYQIMNTSFNQLHLVNTYGAFGSVGRKRYELIMEGTDEEILTAETKWKEYEFLAKPGNPQKKLPIIAPYQPRIAWQIWFAAMQNPEENPWLLHLIWKLLRNDALGLKLITHNPFPGKPPKYIRVSYYLYRFAKPSSKKTWEREFAGLWLPPLSKDSWELERYAMLYGWG